MCARVPEFGEEWGGTRQGGPANYSAVGCAPRSVRTGREGCVNLGPTAWRGVGWPSYLDDNAGRWDPPLRRTGAEGDAGLAAIPGETTRPMPPRPRESATPAGAGRGGPPVGLPSRVHGHFRATFPSEDRRVARIHVRACWSFLPGGWTGPAADFHCRGMGSASQLVSSALGRFLNNECAVAMR